jgi:hypothetical protein
LDVIKNNRLLASDPMTFNDPFEIMPGLIGTPDRTQTLEEVQNVLSRYSSAVRQVIPEFDGQFVLPDKDAVFANIEQNLKPGLQQEIVAGLQRASQTIRIICFCDPGKLKDEDDVLLWSHYGDGHKGARIFFETDGIKTYSTNLFAVNYSHDRACIDITNPGNIITEADAAYRKTFQTKNKNWEYEREVRWIINLVECIQKDRHSYIEFKPHALRRIDFGYKCESKADVKSLLEDDYRHTELYEASMHESKFSLVYKKVSR